MDPLKNPFSALLSVPPPALVGRDAVLDQGRRLWERLALGQAEKGLALSGLRGSGKSVLLQALDARSREAGCHGALLNAESGHSLAALLVPSLRRILLEPAFGDAKTALAVLAGFGLRHAKDASSGDPVRYGPADSGDLTADLAELLSAAGQAAQGAHRILLLFLDGVHALSPRELGALVEAQDRLLREQAPLGLVLAGLPFQNALDGSQKALAARIWSQHTLGTLAEREAAQALQEPARRAGSEFSVEALKEAQRLSKGLPYFLQLWARHAWDCAPGPRVTLEDLKRASGRVLASLDSDFYGPPSGDLSPRERAYLRSMAHLGPGPHRSGDIADSMDAAITALGPLRARLMRKGLVASPGHGLLGFTTPGYDEYMRRCMPHFR